MVKIIGAVEKFIFEEYSLGASAPRVGWKTGSFGKRKEKRRKRKRDTLCTAKDSGGARDAARRCLLGSGRARTGAGTVPISRANYCVLSATYDGRRRL